MEVYLQVGAHSGRLARRGSHHLVAVGTFQKNESGWLCGRLVLEVEQDVLEEHEVSQLPLAVLGGALEQITPNSVVVQGLLGQGQQLKLVHTHSEAVLVAALVWAVPQSHPTHAKESPLEQSFLLRGPLNSLQASRPVHRWSAGGRANSNNMAHTQEGEHRDRPSLGVVVAKKVNWQGPAKLFVDWWRWWKHMEAGLIMQANALRACLHSAPHSTLAIVRPVTVAVQLAECASMANK